MTTREAVAVWQVARAADKLAQAKLVRAHAAILRHPAYPDPRDRTPPHQVTSWNFLQEELRDLTEAASWHRSVAGTAREAIVVAAIAEFGT